MVFTVTLKDPDALYNCIEPAVKNVVAALGLPKDEADAVYEMRCEKEREKCMKWFRYGEYLDVSIDTEAGTCTVLPAK